MAATCAGLGGTYASPCCELRLAAARASPGATYRGVWGSLKRDVACWREFRRIWGMGQDKSFVWTSHWKQFGWAWKLGAAGLHRITRVGQTVSEVNGVSDMVPTCRLCGSVWGGLRKRNGLCQCLCLEESCPQICPWGWTIQFIPVCLWCLSIYYPHVGALRKYVCRPFKRNCLRL